MKKLLLTTVIALLAACGEKEPEPKPFPIGSWQTTRQYFSIVEGEVTPEQLVGTREREESVDVGTAQAYQLTFNENGTGNGSGTKPDGSGRYTFGFTWKLTGDKLTITGSAANPVFYDINFSIDPIAVEVAWMETPRAIIQAVWNVEQFSTDGMVLVYLPNPVELQISGTGIKVAETHTYRYTFEKVE